MVSRLGELLYALFFEYETTRILKVRSLIAGIVKRFIELLVIIYIGCYVLWYQKGYQEFSHVNGAVTTKVKGTLSSNITLHKEKLSSVYSRIWDTVDYVVPPQENGAFFVMTNVIITPNQTLRTCAEIPFNGSICNKNNYQKICPGGRYHVQGHGLMTGKCIPYINNISTCEVHAWCPIEDDDLKLEHPLLLETRNFTVLLKNSVEFPFWNVKLSNLFSQDEAARIPQCRYNKESSPKCPIFQLGYIVKLAGENYTEIARKGGVIAIEINWDCNFDYDLSECIPIYSFRRLDIKKEFSSGFNFRFAHYYSDTNRTLYKALGIRYIIILNGRGGKFSILPTLLNIGSGLGLLSLVEIVCDIIILHLVAEKEVYRKMKILVANENEMDNDDDEKVSMYAFENTIVKNETVTCRKYKEHSTYRPRQKRQLVQPNEYCSFKIRDREFNHSLPNIS